MRRVSLLLGVLLLGGCHEKKKPELPPTFTFALPDEFAPIDQQVFAGKVPEVDPPLHHPPLSLVIGAHNWTVHYTTKKALEMVLGGCEAFTRYDDRTIWLCKCSDFNLRENLLHEVLHAVLKESRNGRLEGHYNEDENSFILPMAPQLLQVLRDNPKFVEWLREEK